MIREIGDFEMRNLAALTGKKTISPDSAGIAQIARIKGLNAVLGTGAAAIDIGESDRVQRVIKAEMGPLSTDNASALVDRHILVSAFATMLRNSSAFFALLDGGMIRAPLRSRLGWVTMSANSWILGEGLPSPLTSVGMDRIFLEPIKAVSLLAVTEELLRSTQSEAALSRELRRAISATVDEKFFDIAIDESSPTIASTGADADDVVLDLRALVEAVNPTVESRLLLVASPELVRGAATMTGIGGGQLFPDLGILGGEIWGVPVLPNDAIGIGKVALLDGSGIAGESDNIEIDTSDQATVELLESTMQEHGVAESVLFSAWQTNSVLFRAICTFGAQRLRDDAVAVLESATWGGSVPAS